MMENKILKIFPTAADLFQSAANEFAERARTAIENQGFFTVVLLGGTTATLFFDTLIKYDAKKIPWRQIKFFFGDERYVAATDAASNYRAACEHLFSKVPIPAENIYRIPTEFKDPQDAAKEYERTLREFFSFQEKECPTFDLAYLGLGDDAHTASLMPFSEVVKAYASTTLGSAQHTLVASLWVPQLKMHRITLTPTAINHSDRVVFLVTGANKAAAVWDVLKGPCLPEQYPAQLIDSLHGKTMWYLDRAAAVKLAATTC